LSWSGNGYHIYIPIESRYVLEETKAFSKYEEPSKRLLQSGICQMVKQIPIITRYHLATVC
jgi:hypothetical protein